MLLALTLDVSRQNLSNVLELSEMVGLYAIIDPELCAGRDPLWLADAVLEGGCALMQLRAKRATDQAILRIGRALQLRCRARGVPFILNDRADLASLLNADGLHLGQGDLPINDARHLFNGCVGLSTHNAAEARAGSAVADLIGIGPIFATQSKENPDPQLGIATLREVCRLSTVPTVAIGGISTENAPDVFDAGVDMVAMISGLSHAEAPQKVAAQIHALGRSTLRSTRLEAAHDR